METAYFFCERPFVRCHNCVHRRSILPSVRLILWSVYNVQMRFLTLKTLKKAVIKFRAFKWPPCTLRHCCNSYQNKNMKCLCAQKFENNFFSIIIYLNLTNFIRSFLVHTYGGIKIKNLNNKFFILKANATNNN